MLSYLLPSVVDTEISLYIQIYLRISVKFEIATIVSLVALGKLIREKNLKLKISHQTTFKKPS
jgi:hypothetical protein